MQYDGTVYRPPVEGYTFLLQVATGCTHNKCTFCNMFKDKKFRMISEDIIRENLEEARLHYRRAGAVMNRIFLVDGDAFAISSNKLFNIVNIIREYFPECETISMYSSVQNVKGKTEEELMKLRNIGINDLYVGHETGLDDILSNVNKGHSVKDSIEQMNRLNTVGIRHHALMMPGIGGKGRGVESGKANADLLNSINPGMILFTTLAVFPETKLEQDVLEGRFIPAGEKEIILEQKTTIEHLNLPDTYLWANHILNSSPIAGILGRDKEKMIQELETSMENMDEEEFEATFRRD